MACCGKMICLGCFYQHNKRNRSTTCPFCRADIPIGKEYSQVLEKRVDSNDSNAYMNGDHVVIIKKDMDNALKLLHRAAELGSAQAYLSYSLWGLGLVRNRLG